MEQTRHISTRGTTKTIPPHPSLSKGGWGDLQANNSRGFTLIEIVITIVLVGILSGIAAMIILQGVRAYSDEQSRSDVHYQARLGMERMAREIRLIRSATAADITAMTAINLQFTDITNAAVNYNYANPNIQRNAIGLATGITAFNFRYFQQDGATTTLAAANVWYVEIDLTATQGSESLQLRTRVHPRNF